MKSFSFIHAADLHIDSPFKGISTQCAILSEKLQRSTFLAFDELIEACISHKVDFLLVAGDVYDGADRGLRAQLDFHSGLTRLANAGIHSFVVHGNHDPLDGRVSSLEWPEEAHVFGKTAETVTVKVNGDEVATVSGISFPKKDVRSNLSKKLEPGPSDLYRIGLLHCNVGSDTGHEPYAPCELADLKSFGMNYWALGHIHTRQTLSKDPLVVYPGNIQGRSIREQDDRGCYLVRVDAHGKAELEFLPLDVIRWRQISVSIDDLDTLDALDLRLSETLEALPAAAAGRDIVCRVRIEGRGVLYKNLRVEGAGDDLLARVRESLASSDPRVWVQHIELDCRPEVDLEQRAQQGDLLAEVLSVAKEHGASAEGLDRIKTGALDNLWQNNRVRKALAELDEEQIRRILTEAELLCLDLMEDNE